MNYFPRSELLAAVSDPRLHDTVRVPGVVVFGGRPRPIFLSDAAPKRQRQMLAFFANSRRRFWAGAVSLQLGRKAAGNQSRVDLHLPAQWQRSFSCDLSSVALYCGSPGPLQKVTLLIPAEKGRPGIIVKISLRATADEMVANESKVLETFQELPATLRARLPGLVDQGLLTSGRRYLATVVGDGAVIAAEQFPDCANFLRELGCASRVDHPWSSGPAMRATRHALTRAQGSTMTDAVHDLLNRALDRVDRQLRSSEVPHVLAHGDFTRFNIRSDGGRFCVFDWEYSRRGANPIADVLHFYVSQPGSWSALTVMHHTLAVAEQMLADTYEGWVPSPRDLAALAMHSLVDTMTFYSNAGTPLDLDSFLVRRYLGLITAADQWGLE